MAIKEDTHRVKTRKSLMSSKRGFLLTMIAFVLVSLFVVYFQISVIRQSQPESVANTARISSISHFVSDLERFYLPNIVSVSLRSSLVGMTNFLSGGNTFIASTNQSGIFYQLLTNGTMYPFNSTIFSNETLSSLLPQFTNLVNSQLNIPLQINYTPYQFSVYQESPWTVSVAIVFLYSVSTSELTYSNRTLLIRASVPIYGLKDPYFLINTRGNYSPNISQSNTSTWNRSKFLTHIQLQQFASNTIAPSYLNRLANNTVASVNGIEFFVNPASFGYNTTAVNYSFVDYQFWTRPWNCTPFQQNLFEIAGISNASQQKNFRIDDAHVAKYVNQTERLSNTTLVCSS